MLGTNPSKGKIKSMGRYHVHDKNLRIDKQIIEIQQGELVYTSSNRSRATVSAGIAASSVPVLSVVNGMKVLADFKGAPKLPGTSANPETLHALNNNIVVVGIARANANSNPLKRNKQVSALTVQIFGRNSLVNTGRVPIIAGEPILAEVPSKADIETRKYHDDIDPEKGVLMTTPLKYYHSSISSTIRDQLDSSIPPSKKTNVGSFVKRLKDLVGFIVYKLSDDFSKAEPDFDKFLESNEMSDIWSELTKEKDLKNFTAKALAGFIDIQDEIDRRVIGKSTSSAQPGQKFDIMLYC